MMTAHFSLSAYFKRMGADFAAWRRYHWRKHRSLLAVAFILPGIAFLLCGFCDYDDATGLTRFVLGMVDDVFGMSDIDAFAGLLDIRFSDGAVSGGGVTISGTITGAISSLHAIVRNLGHTLVLIFFCVGIFEELSFSQMFAEKLVRKFIFLFIAVALVTSSKDLVYGIANIGAALTSSVVEKGSAIASGERVASDTEAIKQAIYNDLKNDEETTGLITYVKNTLAGFGSIFKALGYILELFIPWLISKVCYLIISFVCWSRLIEIMLHAVLSPLMVADVARGEGMNSAAVRGIKNVFALSISGAIIILSLYIGHGISASLVNTGDISVVEVGAKAWNFIVIAIVQTGLVVRANALSKQALGMV